MKPEYLSYSSINLYLTCAENWRRKYILKQKPPSGPAVVVGSVFHGTVERAILERQSMLELWPAVWGQKMAAEGNDIEWAADTPEMHYNDGLRLVTEPAVQSMIAALEPKRDANGPWIERKVELHVPGVPVPIVGYIDIVTADSVPGDFKTSKGSWSQNDAEGEIQPLFYLAALNQMGYETPGNLFRHYVVTKTKKVQAQVIEHSHTWAEIMWLYELIGRVWQGINAEHYPVNPNGWLCSAKWCHYWGDCRGKR